MKYPELENIVSKPRLSRYLKATGDEERAVELYWLNIRLQQSIFAILGILEIGFRNAIDVHYKTIFNDPEWLKNQSRQDGFFFNTHALGSPKSRDTIVNAVKKLNVNYTHDRLVAELSFGFWVNLFAPVQFRLAGQNLHRIFINRPKGTKPKDIYNELVQLLGFRNRVAHHEPICFSKTHQFEIQAAEYNYALITQFIVWLGFDSEKLFNQFDGIPALMEKMTFVANQRN